MYCTTCGNPITAEQAVCSKCGHATTVGNMQGGINRVSQHYRTVAILQIIYAGLHVVGGLAVLIVAKFVFGGIIAMNEPRAPMFIQPLLMFVGLCILAFSAIGLIGGIGLLNREPWARTLTLIAGFLELLNVPLGTALGIYTIWVLLSSGSEEEYRRMSVAYS